jgi:hypothetical protein
MRNTLEINETTPQPVVRVVQGGSSALEVLGNQLTEYFNYCATLIGFRSSDGSVGEGGGGREHQDGIRLIDQVSGDCSAKGSAGRQDGLPLQSHAGPEKNVPLPAQSSASSTHGGGP